MTPMQRTLVYGAKACLPWNGVDALKGEHHPGAAARSVERHIYDSQEQIDKCLNCKWSECVNCVDTCTPRYRRSRSAKRIQGEP